MSRSSFYKRAVLTALTFILLVAFGLWRESVWRAAGSPDELDLPSIIVGFIGGWLVFALWASAIVRGICALIDWIDA